MRRTDRFPAWSMRKRVLVPFCIALAVALTVGAVVIIKIFTAPVASSGDYMFPSETAADWVSYSEVVVVARAVSDAQIPASKKEIEIGEGMIFRRTTLQVVDKLWSSPTSTQPEPSSFDFTTVGTAFSDGEMDDQKEVTLGGSSRIEVGRTYLIALAWKGRTCGEGDPTIPGHWVPLGQYGVLPFEDSVIGQGEFEGKSVSPDELLTRRSLPPFVRSIVGASTPSLVDQLRETSPEKDLPFVQPDMQCP